MKAINTLSTFNGMGCIWYALDRAGIPVNKRYSSEIDKYATQANDVAYSDTIQLGDVRNLQVKDLENIDLFVGGSPCQSFSFAGKRKGMSTKCELIITTLDQYLELKESGFEFEGQSYLFWEYMRILTEIRKYNPDVKFILENVEMGKKWESVLSHAIGVFGVHINSALVSAQNRKRIYWTNIKTKQVGLFGELYSDIPQPKDKGILLKDILQPESEIDKKYYIKNPKFTIEDSTKRTDASIDPIKSHCLRINEGRQRGSFIKVDKQGNEKADQNKAGCLTGGGNSGGNHSDMDIICVSQVGRRIDENGIRKDYDKTIPAVQQLERAPKNKTNCITTVAKDNLVVINNKNSSGNRFFSEDGKHQSLVENGRSNTGVFKQDKYIKKNFRELDSKGNALLASSYKGNRANGMTLVEKEYKLRRLTPRECGKLQTFTDAELDILLNAGISDTQLYKMFGNGWNLDTIAHILSYYK